MTERMEKDAAQSALLDQREAGRQAEEERRRAEASFHISQEANRAKDEFLMTLSHELRTPMTAILGWSRLLPSIPHNDPSFREAVSAIMRSSQLQARLIDDVLDMSRIMSGKLRLSLENVDIAHLLNVSVDAVRPSADAKGITIKISLAPSVGSLVADATRLQQIIWNLLTNAVKFTPKGGTIEVGAHRTASHVQISVTDTGEGIEPHFLPHIFEAFRQAESPSTRTHGGLGLGVSIVRYLSEAHGGTVSAESAGRGKGATFIVTLPIGAVKRAPATVPPRPDEEASADTLSPGKLRGVRILVVDDDREARHMVHAVLRQAGADVTAVESAQHALAELSKHSPHVMLTDIAMPTMDGYALAHEVRQQPRFGAMKIIALSAFPAGRVAAKESGFDEFLTKPIDPFDLVDSIARSAS
jgi:CheY-like chemotaxis protein